MKKKKEKRNKKQYSALQYAVRARYTDWWALRIDSASADERDILADKTKHRPRQNRCKSQLPPLSVTCFNM